MTPHLNTEENNNIDELRMRVKGRMNSEMYEDDDVFSRFLQARDQNIDAAEKMLMKHLNWRKSNKIDSILTHYKAPEILRKYASLNFTGYSFDGKPVTYIPFGNFDPRGISKASSVNEVITYVTWYLETLLRRMKDQTKKLGKLVNKIAVIVDFENFSLSAVTYKQTIESVIKILQVYEANYPETLGTAYIINANNYFTMGWNLVKPFLAAKTARKIHIFGKVHWKEVLLKEIDPKAVPAFLGGTLTNSEIDPTCKITVYRAGPVPERYFKKNAIDGRISDPIKLVVQRMSMEEVEIAVERPDSIIEWEFEVKRGDIAFALVRRDAVGEEVEIIEKHRVDTTSSTESGMYSCEQDGKYYLQFDNSYSWMHSKEISYTVSVKTPKKKNSIH